MLELTKDPIRIFRIKLTEKYILNDIHVVNAVKSFQQVEDP